MTINILSVKGSAGGTILQPAYKMKDESPKISPPVIGRSIRSHRKRQTDRDKYKGPSELRSSNYHKYHETYKPTNDGSEVGQDRAERFGFLRCRSRRPARRWLLSRR